MASNPRDQRNATPGNSKVLATSRESLKHNEVVEENKKAPLKQEGT